MGEKGFSKDYLPEAISDLENSLRSAFRDYPVSSIKLDLIHETDRPKISGIITTKMSPNVFYAAHILIETPYFNRIVVIVPLATVMLGFRRDVRAVYAGFISWWGALVNAPIPTTVLEKRIFTGIITTKRVFIPYYKEVEYMDAKKIFKNKECWNPLLDKLNADEELDENLGRLETEFKVKFFGPWWGSSGNWKSEIDDMGPEPSKSIVVSIPIRHKTLLAAFYPVHAENTQNLVNILFVVAKHIMEFNYNKESFGLIPKGLEYTVKALYTLLSRGESSQ